MSVTLTEDKLSELLNIMTMNESRENSTMEMEEIDEEHLRILMSVVPIVVPIIFTLVIIIGFVGNLLVVLVVILNKKMRNTTNILIFNLAVSGIGFLRFQNKYLTVSFDPSKIPASTNLLFHLSTSFINPEKSRFIIHKVHQKVGD